MPLPSATEVRGPLAGTGAVLIGAWLPAPAARLLGEGIALRAGPLAGMGGGSRLGPRVRLPRTGWWLGLFLPPATCGAFALLLVATFLMGGGSRADIASLAVLRPLAVFCALHGLLALRPGALGALRPLLAGMGLMGVLIGWQLLPLPHGWWAALPGRGAYAEAASLAGVAHGWRPATLSPAGTWNALLALLVPFAGLLTFAALSPAHRAIWPRAVLALGVISALLGFVQIAGPAGSALYLYRITNETEAVGLFANRNHHAVFLAALIPLAAWCARCGFLRWSGGGEPVFRRQALFAGVVLLLLLGVLATGSRAGLICAGLMLLCAGAMLRLVPEDTAQTRRSQRAGGFGAGVQRWFWVSPLVLGLLGFLLAGLASRGTGIDRMGSADGIAGLRVQVLPTLARMIGEFMPLGAGYGSFARAYTRFEPAALLGPHYLNHAHNDWLQILIEGGLPAGCALLLALGWLGRGLVRGWRHASGADVRLGLLCAGAVWLCLGMASLVDYPLRVPSLMLFAVLATTPVCLALHARRPARLAAGTRSDIADLASPHLQKEPCS